MYVCMYFAHRSLKNISVCLCVCYRFLPVVKRRTVPSPLRVLVVTGSYGSGASPSHLPEERVSVWNTGKKVACLVCVSLCFVCLFSNTIICVLSTRVFYISWGQKFSPVRNMGEGVGQKLTLSLNTDLSRV